MSADAQSLRERVHGVDPLIASLRERVHGAALLAAAPTKPPAKKAGWDESSAGKGWGKGEFESKVVRDVDKGEEGQFDFKKNSGKKKASGGGGGGKAKDPAKEAEKAAKKAAAETEKRARDARIAERRRASERKSAEARAKRTKARAVDEIDADIKDLFKEMRAEESARGLKPGADYPGKMQLQKRVALLRLEKLDAALGDDAPIAERIALREKYLAQARAATEEGGTPPEILETLEIDLAAFKEQQAEVEAQQNERKTKKAEAERKKAEAQAKREAAEAKRKKAEAERAAKSSSNAGRARTAEQQVAEARRRRDATMTGLKASMAARTDAAVRGLALPDGSYPIVSSADWAKARTAADHETGARRVLVEDHLEKRGKALGLTAATLVWDEALHPRGGDGKFINKGGFVKGMFEWFAGTTGKRHEIGKGTTHRQVERAEVLGFAEVDGDTYVGVRDPDHPNQVGYAKASEVSEAANTKAQLSEPQLADFPNAKWSDDDLTEGDVLDRRNNPTLADFPNMTWDDDQITEAEALRRRVHAPA